MPDASITARFVRPVGGRLSLEVDCEALHAYLDLIGVPFSPSEGRYQDAPDSGSGWVDTYSHRIRPAALLRKGADGSSKVVWPLSDAYRGPVSKQTLQAIADSIAPAVQAVVEHYQPILLTVQVSMKSAAPTTTPGE